MKIFLNGLKSIKKFLIAIGDAIGNVMTVVILFVIYCTVVALVRIIALPFRKKFVDLSCHGKATSYWIPVEKDFNHHTLEKWQAPF